MLAPAELSAFLLKAYQAAVTAGDPWPDYAACQAALESRWGTSTLAVKGNNLFSEKQHKEPIFETLVLRTWEDANRDGKPEANEYCSAAFVKFPNWAASFASRLATIKRLAAEHFYSGYADALAAKNGADFIRAMARNWATDGLYADKILAIHATHQAVFPKAPAQVPPGSSEDPAGQV